MERTVTSQPPRTLGNGRWVLAEVVGEGGMATVYRAWDQQRSSWCAVKVLSPRVGREAKMRRRFVTEAQAMSLVNHPHVLRIFDVGNEDGLLYLVMELADGGSLEEWLSCYGAMPPRMALDVTLQICEAIGKAHERGIIHRDIKPQNILVGSDGICRVSDFGIARLMAADEYTRTGATLGTVGFSAPEQMSNAKQVDERADVFAIGATMFALITAQSPLDLLGASQEPTVLDAVPSQLAPFIAKATAYRVARRYRSVEEFARALMTVYYTLPENPPDTPRLALPSDRRRELLQRPVAASTSDLTPLGAPGRDLGSLPPRPVDARLTAFDGRVPEESPSLVGFLPGSQEAFVLHEEPEAEVDALDDGFQAPERSSLRPIPSPLTTEATESLPPHLPRARARVRVEPGPILFVVSVLGLLVIAALIALGVV